MSKCIDVMLVDDHAVVREGYRRLLERAGDIAVVAEVGAAEEGERLYRERPVDVVVMDVSLPGVSGIEGTRRITDRFPLARVLMFSMHEEPLFAQRALQAGARGYITKSSAPDILVEAIRSVASGKIYICKEIASQIALRSIPGHQSPLHSLSKREFEIFRLMAQGVDSHVTAERLNVSTKTVSNYLSSIREKLNITNAAQLVHLAIQTGVLRPGANNSGQVEAQIEETRQSPDDNSPVNP
jgi:two-component system, NarL family, invasion response regulator UvrY